MDLVKKLARGVSVYLFRLLILLLAVVSALVITFHSPKNIEKSLSESGVYSSFVDNVLAEAKKSAHSDASSTEIPIDDPAVKTAAHQAFTPQLLQKSTEDLLNGTYDWLSGKTKTPNFNVDLTPAKQTFATTVGQVAANRLNGLPVCTRAQLAQLDPSNIDPFNVPCRPPGLNVANHQAKLVSDINTNKNFLGTTQLNAQSLPKDQNGKTVFDKLSKLPTVYRLINTSPWIFGLLAIVAGVITVWLHDNKRRGLRSLAISLGTTGIVLFAVGIVANWGLHKATSQHGVISSGLNGDFQQTVIKGVNSLFGSIEHVLVWFGIIYIIIAIGILAALHIIKPKTAAPAGKKSARPAGQTSSYMQ